MSSLPLTAYVHLPWCVKKCPYCDFNSHPGQADEAAYVAALLADLKYETASSPPLPALRAVFFGGGTPSLFSARAIGRILEALEAELSFAPGVEITLEANPGTTDAANFRGYRAAGVNRLSIGVQSFSDAQLRQLGRIHDAAAAQAAFSQARRAGFDNINLDLMYGLPQQSPAQAREDIEAALALGPEHLSWYQLTLEPGTAFGRRPPALPDEDHCAEIEATGLRILRRAGYRRYEVSAFAQAGHRSQHNLNYWRFGDYLGLGAGAHGKLTVAGQVRRRARLRSPARYMATAGSAAAVAREHTPTAGELAAEFALNALRVDRAFTRRRFESRTGLNYARLLPAIREAEALALARQSRAGLQVTALGRRHLNRLTECFAEIPGIQ